MVHERSQVGLVYFFSVRLWIIFIPMENSDEFDRTKAGVGRRLALVRAAVGLDQREFAARAGIASSTYNQYETGKNMPDLKFAHALCDAHRLSLDYIYRGDQSALRREIHAAIHAVRQLRKTN